MIGTFEIRCHAAKPQMPLPPMFAFKDSPSSLRLLEIPKKIGEWNITTVKVAVNYPDNTTNIYTASRNGNVWVVTFNGCSITGKVANGLEVLADGTDENGDTVNGYVLGVGDIYILDRDTDIEEAVSKHTMRYCDETPETPVGGDVVIENGALKIYDGTQWISVDIDLSEYATKSELETAASALDNKIDSTKTELESSIAEVASDIPTKTSELTNDSNFITSAQVVPSTNIGMTGYAENSDYATRLKALELNTGLHTDSGIIIPTLNYDSTTNTYTLELYGSVGGYYPWYLHRLFGTDFSPVITLEWRKGTIYRKRVIGDRVFWVIVYNNWMWVAKGQYAITCPTGDGKPDGNFYVLNYEDETHPNYINDPATDVHTITYSNFDITSIDGQAGGQESQTIWCTRTNANPVAIWERPFAYRNELPTKVSDLTNDSGFITSEDVPTKTSELTNDSQYVTTTEVNTALALKQDKLSDAEVSAIDAVVDERKTVVTYTDDTTATYNIVGELKHDQIYVDGKIPKEVRVGDGVTAIESNCFGGNTYLTSLTFGKDVAYLNQGCLQGTGLTSIVIPNKVKEIPDRTITHNSNLTELALNDGLETLGTLAQNTRLAKLKIPSTVTLINPNAFQYATALTEVTFEGKTIAEVQAMANYPWGISDTSIIKTENNATQEWVLEQLSALEARIAALEAIVGGTTITATHSETDDWGGDFDVQTNISLSAYVGLNLTKAKLQPPNGTVTSEFSGSPATVTDWNENITIYADGIGGSQVIAWNKSTGWTNNNVTLMSNAVLYTTYHYPADATRSTLDITIEVKNT